MADWVRLPLLGRDDRCSDRPAALRRADLPGAARPRGRRPGAARDPRPLGPDAVRVRAHPVPARRARPGLLRDHGRQRPGDDPAHGLPGRRSRARGRAASCSAPTRPARPFTVWLLWRERRRLCAGPDTPAAAPDVPLRAADDAGRALALLAQLHRPDHHRPHGRASPRRASTRWRSSSPRAMKVLVRGFQLAWPPLAYSIRDDDEARRAYALDRHLVRRRARLRRRPGCGWSRAGSSGCSPRPSSSPPTRRSACSRPASPSTRLYLVLVVILGRTGRTEFNFPATIAAVVDERGPQPRPGPLAGHRRRRARAGRLLRGRPGADVRVHPAPLPGPVRVAPPGPGAAVCRGAGRRRRAVAADLRRDRPAQPRRALARLPRNPLPLRLPPRGGAHRPGRAPTPVRDRRARQGPSRGDG